MLWCFISILKQWYIGLQLLLFTFSGQGTDHPWNTDSSNDHYLSNHAQYIGNGGSAVVSHQGKIILRPSAL